MIENDSLERSCAPFEQEFPSVLLAHTPRLCTSPSLVGPLSNYKPSTPHSRCQIGLVGNEEKLRKYIQAKGRRGIDVQSVLPSWPRRMSHLMKSPSVRKTSKKLLDSSSSSSSSSSSDEELRIRRNKTLPPQSPERRTVINTAKEKPENRHRPSSRSSVDQPRRRCHSGPRYRHHQQQQYPTHPAAAGWHSWSPSPWGMPYPPPLNHPQCGYCCSPCQVIVQLEIGQRKKSALRMFT